MKKILLITTSYPDDNQGLAAAGVFVQDFTLALAGTGIECHVIAPSSAESCQRENGIDVVRFAVPRLPLSLLNPLRPGDWSPTAATIKHGTRVVIEACAKSRPDHILAFWALPSGYWARYAARRFGISFSTWALGSDIWSLGRLPIVRQILRGVLRDASHRFADGYDLAAQVQRISGKPCEFLPSSRIFPCKPRTEFRDRGPFRLAYLGRWHPNKGVDLLLEALERLDDDAWSTIEAVRIFGGGPLESLVRRKAAELAAAGRPVTAGDYLDRDAAIKLFEWADCVLLPSRIESIPVVFSDAMAAGCPVIAMPVGDMKALVERYRVGLVASSVDAGAFAVLLSPANLAMAADRARNCVAAASDFSVTGAARRFLKCVER